MSTPRTLSYTEDPMAKGVAATAFALLIVINSSSEMSRECDHLRWRLFRSGWYWFNAVSFVGGIACLPYGLRNLSRGFWVERGWAERHICSIWA